LGTGGWKKRMKEKKARKGLRNSFDVKKLEPEKTANRLRKYRRGQGPQNARTQVKSLFENGDQSEAGRFIDVQKPDLGGGVF